MWSDGSTPNFDAFPGAVAPWNPGQPDNQYARAKLERTARPGCSAWLLALADAWPTPSASRIRFL